MQVISALSYSRYSGSLPKYFQKIMFGRENTPPALAAGFKSGVKAKPVTQLNGGDQSPLTHRTKDKNSQNPSGDTATHFDWPRLFMLVLFALVLALGFWASLAKIDRVVRGEGAVVPRDHNQILQHLEGGIMSVLNVREGQMVRAGDIVLQIDDVLARAMLEDNQIKQESLKVRAARLMVEAGKSAQMVLPEGVDLNAPAWISEQSSLKMRQSRQAQEEATIKARLDQRMSELQEANERMQSAMVERQIASERLQMVMNLRAQKAASQMEVLEAQAADARLISVIASTQGTIPRIAAAIEEVRSQLAEMRIRITSDATSELALVQAELSRLEGAIRSQKDRLERTEVRAPVDGIVNHINANTIGGVIKPGDVLVEITPSQSELLVEAKVRPSDRGELRPGLPAKIKISAYDYMGLPPLKGEVIEVSADTLTAQQGEKFYRIKVRLDADQERLNGKSLHPGLSAQVDVVVGQRSVAAYILSPVSKFSDRAFTEAK